MEGAGARGTDLVRSEPGCWLESEALAAASGCRDPASRQGGASIWGAWPAGAQQQRGEAPKQGARLGGCGGWGSRPATEGPRGESPRASRGQWGRGKAVVAGGVRVVNPVSAARPPLPPVRPRHLPRPPPGLSRSTDLRPSPPPPAPHTPPPPPPAAHPAPPPPPRLRPGPARTRCQRQLGRLPNCGPETMAETSEPVLGRFGRAKPLAASSGFFQRPLPKASHRQWTRRDWQRERHGWPLWRVRCRGAWWLGPNMTRRINTPTQHNNTHRNPPNNRKRGRPPLRLRSVSDSAVTGKLLDRAPLPTPPFGPPGILSPISAAPSASSAQRKPEPGVAVACALGPAHRPPRASSPKGNCCMGRRPRQLPALLATARNWASGVGPAGRWARWTGRAG